MHITVTTVERRVFEADDIEKVTLPTTSGEIQILTDHVPLTTVLDLGELRLYPHSGEPISLFVEGGVAQIALDTIDVLAHTAERSEELDEAKIQEARRRAEALLKEKPVDVDLAKVEAALRKEIARLKLAQKTRPGMHN